LDRSLLPNWRIRWIFLELFLRKDTRIRGAFSLGHLPILTGIPQKRERSRPPARTCLSLDYRGNSCHWGLSFVLRGCSRARFRIFLRLRTQLKPPSFVDIACILRCHSHWQLTRISAVVCGRSFRNRRDLLPTRCRCEILEELAASLATQRRTWWRSSWWMILQFHTLRRGCWSRLSG
jgi:hypothetical protein